MQTNNAHLYYASFYVGKLGNDDEVILDVQLNQDLVPPTFTQSVYSYKDREVKIPSSSKVSFNS